MKSYKMLKTVKGSRDGIHVEVFNQGETYKLPADLAEQFYHHAAVEEVAGEDDAPSLREGVRDRSTKVTGPTETKEGEAGVPLDTQNIEELVATARDIYGLEVDSTMDEQTLRTMIEQAQAEQTDEDDTADKAKKNKKRKA